MTRTGTAKSQTDTKAQRHTGTETQSAETRLDRMHMSLKQPPVAVVDMANDLSLYLWCCTQSVVDAWHVCTASHSAAAPG